MDVRVLSQELSCSTSSDKSELHSSKFQLELFLNCQLYLIGKKKVGKK